MDDLEKHRILGSNNPDLSPSSPNYGYEVWIEVGPEVEPKGDLRVVSFDGGLYAVTLCEVPEDDSDFIGQLWKKLITWHEDSRCHHSPHQWLEVPSFTAARVSPLPSTSTCRSPNKSGRTK